MAPRPDSSPEKTTVAAQAKNTPTTATIGPIKRRGTMLGILNQADSIDCEDEAADRNSQKEAKGGCAFNPTGVSSTQDRDTTRRAGECGRYDDDKAEYVVDAVRNAAGDED